MVCVLTAMTPTAVNLRWTAWMLAYRQSTAYDRRGDVSLTTINVIVLGVFVVLLALFLTRHISDKAVRKDQTPNGRK